MAVTVSRRTLLALGASLGALPRAAGAVLRTPPGGALRWPLLAPWRVSDPARAVDLADAMMTGLVHDTLATLSPDGTVLYPLLVAPPTLSADGLRATLTLRPDMRFANGAPLTAQAVAASWQAARGGVLGRLVLAFGQSMAPFAVRGSAVLSSPSPSRAPSTRGSSRLRWRPRPPRRRAYGRALGPSPWRGGPRLRPSGATPIARGGCRTWRAWR